MTEKDRDFIISIATGQRRLERGSCGIGSLWPNGVIRPPYEVQVDTIIGEDGLYYAVLAQLDMEKYKDRFGSIHHYDGI